MKDSDGNETIVIFAVGFKDVRRLKEITKENGIQLKLIAGSEKFG